MKKLIRKIAEFFRAHQKLKLANSYIAFLRHELSAFSENVRQEQRLAEECRKEIEMHKGANYDLTKVNKHLLGLCEQLRKDLHQRGSTDAERDFINVCKDIYTNGRMISRLQFESCMYEVLKQREMTCINRDLELKNEKSNPEGLPRGG
ncbi:hypothetical protein BSR03_17275 [Serratia proteamaculans]|uniref:hypothetical protein n=1 Tax=Serratia proteamaculans TaxID=28151 RepID=UPI0010224DC8|nr:hypothetical protein [Serratia proteamaculans]RYM60195.1 hypothetical protein BSR03_17275 [Serratia proteamaculans]